MTNVNTDRMAARLRLVDEHVRLENGHDLEGIMGTFGATARYDDELIIRADVTEIGRARLTIGYEVTALDGTQLASGYTTHVVMNEEGRPQRIPAEFRQAALGRSRCLNSRPCRSLR